MPVDGLPSDWKVIRDVEVRVPPLMEQQAIAASIGDMDAEFMHAWHKSLLHGVVPGLVAKWQPRLGVRVNAYFLQRMKTKWGSCNVAARHIRLNTELVKKPKDLLEYVVVHEMLHLRVATHGRQFLALLDTHYPTWREARQELNDLPLAAEQWRLHR